MEETKKEERRAALDAAKVEAKRMEQQGVFGAANVGKDGVVATVYSGRDSTGRFAVGNPGGPGRGTKRQETAIIEALKANIQPETVADVVLGLLTHPHSWRANAAGADLYFKYMLGPAPARTPESENVIDVILAKMRDARG